MVKGIIAISVAAAVAGCVNLGADYKRPETAIPKQFRGAYSEAEARSAGNVKWWDLYKDETLIGLIKEALDKNRDIQLAVARVDESRALIGPTDLAKLPQIDFAASATRDKLPERGAFIFPPGTPLTRTIFSLGPTFSYEIDLWGRVANLSNAARADYLGTQYVRESVRTALIADVAATYFDILSLRREVAITKNNIKTREQFLDLTNKRYQSGRASQVDSSRAEASLLQARAQLSPLEQTLMQLENKMQILLGRGMGGAMATIPETGAVPNAPEVPAGLPSTLLERRPDILAAETALLATSSRVRAVRASLFPTISLTGGFGFTSRELNTLFDRPAFNWSIGANLLAPIINAQRNKFQVRAAEAREQQAAITYLKTVEQSFREVSDSIIARAKLGELRATADAQVKALVKLNDIVLQRYQAGLASYFEVIDAQQNLLTAELAATEAQRNLLSSSVNLYRALGGGWEPPTLASANGTGTTKN